MFLNMQMYFIVCANDILSNNLNITKIEIFDGQTTECLYPYSLESPDWKQMQINAMKAGYESYSMR